MNINSDLIVKTKNLGQIEDEAFKEEIDTYSTNEVKTNKVWVDGKPIYRKVLNTGTLPNHNLKYVNHNITNLGVVIDLYGWAFRPQDNSYYPLPYTTENLLGECIRILITGDHVTIATGMDRSNLTTSYVVIEYTKAN